jgi:hypothetical protein
MLNLFKKIILFLLPFALWIVLVVLVDPYNYFSVSSLVSDNIKKNTSVKLNPRLWKCIEFKKHPSANILLGDSRVNSIDTNYIKTITGDNFFNFAYGGASIAEIVDTFNYAKSISHLSKVYIGMSFNLYNSYNSVNVFSGAKLLSNDYKYYLIDRSVAKTIYYNLSAYFSDNDFQIGIPSTDKDSFWKYQLSYAGSAFYQHYRYPLNYYNELKKMADYCKENKVDLVFFIPPTHIDLQNIVKKSNLLEAERRFKNDLVSLGEVYDFDYPNDVTKNRDNFSDPFHFHRDVMKIVANDVWGKSNNLARVYRH